MADQTQAITIRFQLSKSDVYRALVRNIVRKAWFLALVPIVGVSSVLIALLEPAKYGDQLYSGVLTILFGAFFFLGVPYAQARSAMKNPSFRGPLVYTFSGEGILTEGKYASGRMDWELVKGVSESDRYIFVRMAQDCFHVIPKNQVSEADTSTLKSILRTCVKGKVRLKP